MSEFKQYRKAAVAEMRPYVPGESLVGISMSEEDLLLPSLDGGMIARNTKNHSDQWYVAKKFFDENYVPAVTAAILPEYQV